MKRRDLLKNLTLAIPALYLSNQLSAAEYLLTHHPSEDVLDDIFKPTWQSLKQFKPPEWFRDAKFGIWAHWGPQCQPENGDWYARSMYDEGSTNYNFHLKKYGHPSKFGFKDVINEWKAENWNPDELVTLYKDSGAKYFMAMANHHDNLDLYDSKYQQWNSLKVGPKKDIIAGWEKAARKNGLHFGVSVHASHAWNWYETSQRADKTGAFTNIPYDGKLTKKDGKGTWWEGMDPQELYEQNHILSEGSDNVQNIHKQWDWGNGVAIPSDNYCNKFLNRTIDLIDKYNPDLVYFDDTALPLWPISNAGLKIAAHLYNKSIKKNKTQKAVIFGKILDEEQRQCMVWDIERGKSNIIEPLPWQTDTCIGQWHYKRSIFEEHKYKSAKTVIHILIDVVSKNGNLCLNIPIRGDGTIDEDERNVVLEIGEWMKINSEAIYETRPWKIFGEGPAQENVTPLKEQGYNEVSGKPFSSLDYRFTVKGNALYAIGLEWPENRKALIKSLSMENSFYPHSINRVELLGGGELKFLRTQDSLEVVLPSTMPKLSYAFVLRIT